MDAATAPQGYEIVFDAEDDLTYAEIGEPPFVLAWRFDWCTAVVWPDKRFNYGEDRYVAVGAIRGYPHIMAFAMHGRRIQVRALRRLRKEIWNPRKKRGDELWDFLPEVDEAFYAVARPTREVMGEAFMAWARRRRPKRPRARIEMKIPLDQRIRRHLLRTGEGWQTRVNEALAREIRAGRL